MKARFLGAQIVVIIFSVLLFYPSIAAHAASASHATTKIMHEVPGKKYIPGFRINLDIKITDEANLLAKRCYFKTKNDKNFAFIDLFHHDDNLYKVILPAPFVNSEEVNYLFVVVNNKKQVSRTKLFTLEEGETKEATTWKEIDDVENVRLDKAQDAAEKYVKLYDKNKKNYIDKLPDYQSTDQRGRLNVKLELPRSFIPLKGFYDLATITEIPASAKYGFLAEGLYSPADIAAGGGTTSTGATSAGTVAVSSGGMSTSTMVLIGVAGAAAIGGGIAIASGGGGGGGHHDDGPAPLPPKPLDPTTILGAWNYAGHRRDGVARSGRMNFSNNGTYTWTIVDADHQSDGSGSGTWTLSGATLALNFDTGKRWRGSVSGNSKAFDYLNTGHGSYHYTR